MVAMSKHEDRREKMNESSALINQYTERPLTVFSPITLFHCEPIELCCRGFAGRSICKALAGLEVTGAVKRGANTFHHWSRRKSHTMALDKEGEPVDECCWDAIRDLINLGWVTCVWGCLMLKDPKPPMTPGTSLMMHPSASKRCI